MIELNSLNVCYCVRCVLFSRRLRQLRPKDFVRTCVASDAMCWIGN